MQAQQKFYTKLYLPNFWKIKVPHLLLDAIFLKIAPSVALLFFIFILCSVFKVQVEEYTLKIEQCKTGLSTAKSLPGFRRVTTFEWIRRRASRAAVIHPEKVWPRKLRKACGLTSSP